MLALVSSQFLIISINPINPIVSSKMVRFNSLGYYIISPSPLNLKFVLKFRTYLKNENMIHTSLTRASEQSRPGMTPPRETSRRVSPCSVTSFLHIPKYVLVRVGRKYLVLLQLYPEGQGEKNLEQIPESTIHGIRREARIVKVVTLTCMLFHLPILGFDLV